MPITVRKELLINTGKFENIKIIAEIQADNDNFKIAWDEVNRQILEQESLERATRLKQDPPKPQGEGWKPADDLPF